MIELITTSTKVLDLEHNGVCVEINTEKNARNIINTKAIPLSIAVIIAITFIKVSGALKFVNGLLLLALK